MDKHYPKRVLCVCIGNSDRSPVLAEVLAMFLKNAGFDCTVESAGIHENARQGTAAKYGVAAAATIGLDVASHRRHHISDVNLASFGLIICASDEIAGAVIEAGANMSRVYNAQIPNPWPVQFQEDYDAQTMPAILTATYRVMCRYFRPATT